MNPATGRWIAALRSNNVIYKLGSGHCSTEEDRCITPY